MHAPEPIGAKGDVVPREEVQERFGNFCKQRSKALHEERVGGMSNPKNSFVSSSNNL